MADVVTVSCDDLGRALEDVRTLIDEYGGEESDYYKRLCEALASALGVPVWKVPG
jgi:hypothetical protein